MCRQWEIARHCHTALSILLLNIQRQESSGSNRLHQSDNENSTHSERSKKRRTTFPGYEGDHSTYNSFDNGNYQTDSSLQDSLITTAAPPQTDMSHPSSSISITTYHPFSEPTTRIYQDSGADDTTISPSEVSILAMPDNIEGLQWPDESSFLTTNFDLNMTDLFQNSSWDPMLFDAFNNQG